MPTTTAKRSEEKEIGENVLERNSLDSVSGRLGYGIAHVSSVKRALTNMCEGPIPGPFF